MTIKPIYKRVAMAVIAVTLAFTGLMGFAHTKAGRPVLVYLGKLMGKKEFCPLGFDQAETLTQREERRRSEALRHAQFPIARTKAALAFELGVTTRVQIERWALANRGSCHGVTSAYQIECEGAFFGSTTSTLWLEFDGKNILVGLHGIQKYTEPAPALAAFTQTREALRAQPKVGYRESGEAAGRIATSGLLAQAAVHSSFRDFKAVARLTKMGDGFAVTQDFLTF